MITARFDGQVLPLNFHYIKHPKARITTQKTIIADVTHTQTYYEGDSSLSFDCKFCSSTIYSKFLTVYKASTSITFIDYDSASTTVLLTEYSYEEESGLYNISGTMKVMA